MFPKKIYYEPKALDFELGQRLKDKYTDVEWIPIKSHNNIEELRNRSNSDFVEMKKYLIIGIRKTHKYVENQKGFRLSCTLFIIWMQRYVSLLLSCLQLQ